MRPWKGPVLALALSVTFGSDAVASTANLSSSRIFAVLERTFDVSVRPIGGFPVLSDQREVAEYLEGISHANTSGKFIATRSFLASHPSSAYRANVALGMGLELEKCGRYSEALGLLDQAYTWSKDAGGYEAHQCSSTAIGERAFLSSRSGDVNKLRLVLSEAKRQEIYGGPGQRVRNAAEIFHRYSKGQGFAECAKDSLSSLLIHMGRRSPKRWGFENLAQPPSLLDVQREATRLHLPYRLARVDSGDSIPANSIAHLNLGHFVFVQGLKDGKVLVEDPSMGGSLKLDEDSFRAEMSGAFLVSNSAPVAALIPREAARYRGAGPASTREDSNTGTDAQTAHGPQCEAGLTSYDFQLLSASVTLRDTPVGYKPAVGPDVKLRVSYSQADTSTPRSYFSSFGSGWQCNFCSYAEALASGF